VLAAALALEPDVAGLMVGALRDSRGGGGLLTATVVKARGVLLERVARARSRAGLALM